MTVFVEHLWTFPVHCVLYSSQALQKNLCYSASVKQIMRPWVHVVLKEITQVCGISENRAEKREKKYSSFGFGGSLIAWCSWIIYFKLKHWAVQVTCICVCLCLVGQKYSLKGCVWIGRKTAFSNVCLIYGLYEAAWDTWGARKTEAWPDRSLWFPEILNAESS